MSEGVESAMVMTVVVMLEVDSMTPPVLPMHRRALPSTPDSKRSASPTQKKLQKRAGSMIGLEDENACREEEVAAGNAGADGADDDAVDH